MTTIFLKRCSFGNCLCPGHKWSNSLVAIGMAVNILRIRWTGPALDNRMGRLWQRISWTGSKYFGLRKTIYSIVSRPNNRFGRNKGELYVWTLTKRNNRNLWFALQKIQTPWKAIFTSLPFISLLLAHCAQNWGFWILLTEIPSYLKYTMGFDIQSNALLSALPYLVMYVVTIIMSFLSDWLLNRNLLSVGQCRKLFNSIGIFIPMIALLGLGYVSVDSPILIIVLLTVCVGVNGATYVGYMVTIRWLLIPLLHFITLFAI